MKLVTATLCILRLSGCHSAQVTHVPKRIQYQGRSLELFRTDLIFLQDHPADLKAFAEQLKLIVRMTGTTNEYVLRAAGVYEDAFKQVTESLNSVQREMKPGDTLFFYHCNEEPDDLGKLILDPRGRVKWIRRETFE
jgi:hypothetical protein